MGAVGPGRDVGAGQIARGETVGGGGKFPAKKKRESIVFPFHSPWEKKKTSEAQAAVFHWANTRNLV